MSPSAAVARDGGAYVTAAVQQPLPGTPHPLRPLRGAYTAAAPSIVSAIATDIAKGDIMNLPHPPSITRTARSLRRSFQQIAKPPDPKGEDQARSYLQPPAVRQNRLRLPGRSRRSGQRQPPEPQTAAHRIGGAARRWSRLAAGQCNVCPCALSITGLLPREDIDLLRNPLGEMRLEASEQRCVTNTQIALLTVGSASHFRSMRRPSTILKRTTPQRSCRARRRTLRMRFGAS